MIEVNRDSHPAEKKDIEEITVIDYPKGAKQCHKMIIISGSVKGMLLKRTMSSPLTRKS